MEQKTEIPGIYKAEEGVLLNKDNLALQAYKNRKARERKLEIVSYDIEMLKKDMSELKELIKGFLK
jgi:hypothetical protein